MSLRTLSLTLSAAWLCRLWAAATQSPSAEAQALLREGNAYTQSRDLGKAADSYRQALALDPALWQARKNLATVLWFLGSKRESEREFRAVAQSHPEDAVPHLYLGLAAHERRQFAEARRQFAQAGPLASDNPEVLPAVIESYLAAKDDSLPNRLIEQLRRAENPDPALVLRLAVVYTQYGRYQQSITALEKLTPGRATAESYRMLGDAYDRLENPEKAYAAYRKAVEMAPSAEENYLALSAFASAHGNNAFALKIVDEGLARSPRSSRLVLERGILLALEGDRERAEQCFRQAGQMDPRSSAAFLALGTLQMEGGDAREAVASFRHAMNAAPADHRAPYLCATALIRSGAQENEAGRVEIMALLQKAIQLDPNDPKPRVSLGQAYLAAGKPDAALIEFEQAVKLDPQQPAALYQLAKLYHKQGKTEAARRALEAFGRAKARSRESEGAAVQILKLVRGR